jgi:hypothetical protein
MWRHGGAAIFPAFAMNHLCLTRTTLLTSAPAVPGLRRVEGTLA